MPLRTTIVGAASGVVLLAGVFGFAVGLPEVVDDGMEPVADTESDEGTDGRPATELLPATLLDGALQRYPEIDPQYTEMVNQVEVYGGERLTEAFGTDTAVALYTTPDIRTQVAVTIYDGESGLFLQQGPPVPREVAANSQTYSDFLQQGDSVCIGQWQVQALEQEAPPFQVQCQRTVAGRTVNVYAAPGLTVEQTADIVDDVVTQAGLE